MNNQYRAAGRTLGMIATAILIPVVLIAIFSLNPEIITWILLGLFSVFMVWIIYSINLGQLETEETIKGMQERREEIINSKLNN
jgi:c-di-AMP phosphodiesterase-like protein